ncbi:DUF2207 domain-containing protein [Fodinibius sp. Rm-B-1B1-1]|uniref:DUF2207 domain-containing protein n=1 Tax=Fodinibius alkaliphilus TaxID=3140241 RepID=UPI003159A933
MWLRTFLLSALLFTVGLTEPSAKSYEIPEIHIEVSINKDGTVLITEHLTYDFDGSFSWAQYQLPKQGFTGIRNIKVSENGTVYLNKNNEEKGTFSVSESDEYIRLKWHFIAEDERRTFTVSYTLEGALTIGPKWSQFFWNYLSDERDKSTKKLNISINYPEAVPSDSLFGWTRRPLGRMDLQKEQGRVKISGKSIDDNDFAKVRALFPTSILTNPEITVPDFTLSQVRSEELAYDQKIAERNERKQYWDQTGEVINYVILLLALIIFYVLYQKYGKRYSTSHLSSTETIVTPSRERPAAVGWLLNGRHIVSVHLISTVLDLARRGYFKIRERKPKEGMLEDDDPTFLVERTGQSLQDDLLDWEQDTIQFIEKRLDEDIQQLHKIFKGSNSEVSGWFSKWKNKFKTYCFNQNWIDLTSYNGAYWNLGIQLLLFSIVVGLIFYIGTDIFSALSPSFVFSWFGALITTFVLAILSLIIIRPTQKGEEIKHQWNNYKKGLKNAEEHHISSDKLDKHFIYALAFGLGKDKIEKIFTSHTDTMPVIAWMVFNTNTTSPAAVANTFSTLSATGAASAPGTSGGAGASASAAGGGASASAG